MTDWAHGYPPPPYNQAPPPSGPVTPEQLKGIAVQLVTELQRLNVLLPALTGQLTELNGRLAVGAGVDPQATGIAGVVGGIRDVMTGLGGLGLGIDPPGRAPPKRRR